MYALRSSIANRLYEGMPHLSACAHDVGHFGVVTILMSALLFVNINVGGGAFGYTASLSAMILKKKPGPNSRFQISRRLPRYNLPRPISLLLAPNFRHQMTQGSPPSTLQQHPRSSRGVIPPRLLGLNAYGRLREGKMIGNVEMERSGRKRGGRECETRASL